MGSKSFGRQIIFNMKNIIFKILIFLGLRKEEVYTHKVGPIFNPIFSRTISEIRHNGDK